MKKKRLICLLLGLTLIGNSFMVQAANKAGTAKSAAVEVMNNETVTSETETETPETEPEEGGKDDNTNELPDNSMGGEWKETNGKWWYQKADGSYYCNEIALIDGKYYSFDEYGYRRSGWLLENKAWYYFGADGAMKTGWIAVGGYWFYLGEDGKMQTGWQKVDGSWYYLRPSGEMAKGWITLSGYKFYLNASGEMVTGWRMIDGSWYYFASSGEMKTGWQAISGYWYYLSTSGAMVTGWKQIGGSWFYFKDAGEMATGWHAVGGKWFYFKNSGEMQTGWQYINGNWFYLNAYGDMKTGWLQQGGKWYYLRSFGDMAVGWQYVDGLKYYFNTSGVMSTDVRSLVSGPYYIKVNRQQNCVTIYAKDGNNGFTIPAVTFLCSTGGSLTPLGTFTMSTQYRWHQLFGAMGQYCSRIVDHILFHSVPYFQCDSYTLMPGQFNRLGSNASSGCVRLTTGDAKWIYDNCTTGSTQITIYDSSYAGPFGKPTLPKIPYSQNWDPTDPNIR